MIANPEIVKAGSVVKTGAFTPTSYATVTVPDLIGAQAFMVVAMLDNDTSASRIEGSKITAIFYENGVLSFLRASAVSDVALINLVNSTSASGLQFDAETGTFTVGLYRPSGFIQNRKYCYVVW